MTAELTALLEDLRRTDAYRADGAIVACPNCGYPVRRIETEADRQVLVAPFPLRGNWDRPVEGYGEDRLDGRSPDPPEHIYLWVFPTHIGRAQRGGWTGGARRFDRPPPTVEGYRDHAIDCPART
ncbi:MAG: hypothetical protein AAF594_14605 [Bacteroidota bacterium]